MKQSSYAPFVQAELDVTTWLKLRGGVRYEDLSLDIPTFTTIPASVTLPGGRRVEGGTLGYSETVFNFGAVVDVTDNISLFAGYSQGFSVADIGGSLRTTTVSSVEAFSPKAQLIDNYEVGIRAHVGPVQGSFATFISKSNLGATYAIGTFVVIRANEKVDGYEATLDWTVTDNIKTGATYTHTGGLRDLNGDGELDERLDTTRIGPPKLTAYVDYLPLPDWTVRLQLMNASTINRFPNDPRPISGRAKIEGYTLVDLTTSFPFLGGTLGIGVKNLLNEDYFTLSSQRQVNNAQYVQGVGRTGTITYTVRY
ncbi:MAG: TonB-dependent receptor [Steroidobacter sp.]|nr:TonB-dependent receptor [Steroidobacter sp.]